MEISNRKLFSRGMVAIGFAVAVSGIPGDAFAADQPETAAVVATAQKEDNELSEREKALRRQKFAEQDARIEAARKMDFENGKKEFQAVIAELADPAHNYAPAFPAGARKPQARAGPGAAQKGEGCRGGRALSECDSAGVGGE